MFLVIDTAGDASPVRGHFTDGAASDALGGMVLRMAAGDMPYSLRLRTDAVALPFNPVCSIILSRALRLPVPIYGPVAFGGYVDLGPDMIGRTGIATDLPPARAGLLAFEASVIRDSLTGTPAGPDARMAENIRDLASLIEAIPMPASYPDTTAMLDAMPADRAARIRMQAANRD